MTPVKLEPAAPRSQVKHSTSEPLRSLSIASIPFEIHCILVLFDRYIYISGQDSVSHARMVTLPCFLFELSPLNELEKGKVCKLKNLNI